MKLANDNLNISDSQTLNSSYTLSLPSEPPDLRNWFSSYVYESPGFDSNAELVDGSCGNQENKDGDLNDVPESLSSPSILSAPHSIQNWFSSYVYEYPGPSPSGFYEGSAFGEGEFKKYGIENSSTKKIEGVGELFDGEETLSKNHEKSYEPGLQSAIQVSESLSSAAALPARGGNIYLGESATEGKFCEVGFSLEESSDRKEEYQVKTGISRSTDEFLNVRKIVSNVFREPNTSLGDDEHGMHSIAKKPSDKSSGDDMLQNNGIELKDVVELNLDVKDIMCRAGGFSSNETNFTTEEMNATLGYRYRNEINSVEADFQHKFDPAQSDSKLENGISLTKSTCLGLKEPTPDDGFIRTKQSRRDFKTSDENCKKRQEKRSYNHSKENPIVSINGEKDVRKRKVLAETTNLTSSNVIEFTGKWQCPQKNKPQLGPPLKQLRLEKWLNRT